MENYTISEYVELPSKGLIYPQKVASEIHLSSMTTRHEMQRLAPSKSQLKPLCDVLDDCIIGDLGISSYDLYSGDYQFLMFKLRIATYGPEIKLIDYCPYCDVTSELAISLDDLEVVSDIDAFDKYRSFHLPKTNKDITLKYQTPRLLDNIERRAREFDERTKNTLPDQHLAYLLSEMIDTIDGATMNQLDKEEWVKELPMMDVRVIETHIQKLDTTIGVDTNLTVECEKCGKEHNTQLRIGSEFFRPEIYIG